jgi:hypothetical protein
VWETTEASDIYYRSGQPRLTEWRQVRWSGNRTVVTNSTAVLDVSMCIDGAADCIERVPELRRYVVALVMMLTSTTKPLTLTLPSGVTTTSGLPVTSPVQTVVEQASGFDNFGAFVGGTIGGLALLLAVGVGAFCMCKSRTDEKVGQVVPNNSNNNYGLVVLKSAYAVGDLAPPESADYGELPMPAADYDVGNVFK